MRITISDYFELNKTQEELDFFNADLSSDTMLFIDPFLLKRSIKDEEKELFLRFDTFFGIVISYLLQIKLGGDDKYLVGLVNFREPKEINLGYTTSGNSGKGPGKTFGDSIIRFFKSSVVSKVFKKELYGENGFNPNLLRIFVDGLGPDGISDFTASIIMDYLILFTQEQCKLYNINTKKLPSPKIFDFDEKEWFDGYYDLPENPRREGMPIIFVPKHLLRYIDDGFENSVKRKVIGFLREDDLFKDKFSKILDKALKDISLKEIRKVLLSEETILQDIISDLEKNNEFGYDFKNDLLELASSNNHRKIVENCNISLSDINKGEDLFKLMKKFITFLQDEYVIRDGWKNAWNGDKHCTEPTFGNIIRGVGNAYFMPYKDITFIPEPGTGNGHLDFSLIYKSTKISIELKNLGNSSTKGIEKIVSYIHGISKQLPSYINGTKSNYGFYITLQHYEKHNERISEINDLVNSIESDIKINNPDFKKLVYVNLDLTKKPTASNI